MKYLPNMPGLLIEGKIFAMVGIQEDKRID